MSGRRSITGRKRGPDRWVSEVRTSERDSIVLDLYNLAPNRSTRKLLKRSPPAGCWRLGVESAMDAIHNRQAREATS